MISISRNNIITVNRGDSINFLFCIIANDDFDIYELNNKDTLYVGVLEPNCSFEDAIIRKVFTAEDLTEDSQVLITLSPEDTEYLLPGTYYLQIKLKRYTPTDDEEGEYSTETVLGKTKFIILD